MQEMNLSNFSLVACSVHLSVWSGEGAAPPCAPLSSFAQLIVGQSFQLKRWL